jgi:outer membrane protein W
MNPTAAPALVRLALVSLSLGCAGLFATGASAQPSEPSRWAFRVSGRLTGTSAGSTPEGYRVYSAIGFGIASRRQLSQRWRVDVSTALDSREVEERVGSLKTNLGSLESIPVTAVVQFAARPGKTVRPYLSAGANVTLFWEKSGSLDSADASTSIGPAAGAGLDCRLSESTFLTFDFTWVASTTKVTNNGARLATIRLHPTALSIGLGFHL